MTPTLPLPVSSIAGRVALDWVTLAGGARAVLLQVAHPSVADGVARFSTYRSDPWNRFSRTLDTMVKLTFGDGGRAAEQARQLAARHRRVAGTDERGRRYSALDPDLLLWVWATLADTAVVVHERAYGALPAAEREQLHREQVPVAVACGVPEHLVPADVAGFDRYVQRVLEHELHVTAAALDVCTATLVPPLPTPLRQLLGPVHAAVTTELLPPPVRRGYGLVAGPGTARATRRFFAVARASRHLPLPVRQLPGRLTLRRERPIAVPGLAGAGAGSRILERRYRPR